MSVRGFYAKFYDIRYHPIFISDDIGCAEKTDWYDYMLVYNDWILNFNMSVVKITSEEVSFFPRRMYWYLGIVAEWTNSTAV